MAQVREYAYYIKGEKIALVEKDGRAGTLILNDDGSSTGTYSKANGTGEWKSPLATVADGLKIEYTYSPEYFIESTDLSTDTVASWDQDNNGHLRFHASGGTDWTSSPNLSSVTYIVLKKAGRFNGLHKVSSVTNNRIVTTTKVSASTSETLFEETVTLYYDVAPFIDESFDINVTRYQSNAIVYYVKAKLAEDMMDMEAREFFMREFKRQLEKGASALKRGPYIVQGLKEMR